MIKGFRVFGLAFLLLALVIGIAGCDQAMDTGTETPTTDDVEVAMYDAESEIIAPFDEVRTSSLEFEIDGIESGSLEFIADNKVYPEKVDFENGQVEIDEFLSARVDNNISVIVKDSSDRQVQEFNFDLESIDDEDKIKALSDETPDEKIVGLFVDENYSREFNSWIYFDNWYINDMDFLQQFNLLLYLFDRHEPAFYVDEVNNTYGTWEEFKVVGRDNLEEIDGEFEDFFREAGYEWDTGILYYLDAERGEYVSSFGYELNILENAMIDGSSDHHHFYDKTWEELVDLFMDEDEKNIEIEIESIGDKELDEDAIRDIAKMKWDHDFSEVESIEVVDEIIYIEVDKLVDEYHWEWDYLGLFGEYSIENDGIFNLTSKETYYDDATPILSYDIGDDFWNLIDNTDFELRFVNRVRFEVEYEDGEVRYGEFRINQSYLQFYMDHRDNFNAEIKNYDEKVIEDHNFRAEAIIENIGEGYGEQDVEYVVNPGDNEFRKTETVHLGPEEFDYIDINHEILDKNHGDNSIFEIWTYDDHDYVEFEVVEYNENVEFEFVDGEMEISPDPVSPGEELTVSVKIENTGESGYSYVELHTKAPGESDWDYLDRKTFHVDPDQSETFEYQRELPDDIHEDEMGEYELKIKIYNNHQDIVITDTFEINE